MSTILRVVKCKERTPKESGSYPTFIGHKWFNTETNLWTEFCPSAIDDNQKNIQLVFWLEKIELPSSADLIKEFGATDSIEGYKINRMWLEGAKWMRDFVLAATPNEVSK